MWRGRANEVGKGKRGFALIEFTMIAVPVIFLTISVIEASLAMWQYHTMMYAVELAGRYVVTHGRGCTQNGNTCSLTTGNVANLIAAQAPALDSSKLSVTLTTSSGTVTTCSPVNTCFSNTTQFPSATDNGVNLDVIIGATYPISNPMPFFWPGSPASSTGTFTLGASSRQRILF
jgi:Flp pilus assembly protein TadG